MLARLAITLAAAVVMQAPAFRVETRLVVLQVSVRTGRGGLVTDLERGAFTVYENGKPQPISVFRRDDIPVSLGILIDNSGSMRSRRATVEAAALAFARASNPDDELFVLNFADKPHIDVPFTSDVRVLEAGIARVDAIGGTAMRDAVDLAEAYLTDHATLDRKVLLVITDGNDNASLASLERILQQAAQHDIVIYAVGLLNAERPSSAEHARHELDQLTEKTGGLAYYPPTIEAIDAVTLDIARQIRNQYTLAYAPLNQALDGSYRTIRVRIAARERLSVRTRAGYYAAPARAR
jgi:VWFA-related protein